MHLGGGGGTCGRSTGAELKALVTDVSLSSEMSGVELAQYAKRKFPHINVVMVSGRSPPYIPQDTSFLLKPHRPKNFGSSPSLRPPAKEPPVFHSSVAIGHPPWSTTSPGSALAWSSTPRSLPCG